MANSQFNIKIVITDNGGVKLAEKNISQLGAAVERTGRQHRTAARNADDLYDTQKKGLIGTANSTRSFSKLAETLGRGGSSGLVGAYATLAANIFAVTAAFNALRTASQVEQIFKGLEAAGTRVGLSLNTTAKALKEVSGAAISTEQAMRSTAQITSAGFDAKAVERLGRAARDTSFALGRNMTDSLDRLSRGVVKLEPELLDELGIMTKITESNIRYAQQLGKTESQLSNFEKRQGFLNAVLAEAELKFGGLSEAAGDSTAYDRLAASFTDLANSIFNAVNIIAKPIAGILADSSMLLAAGLLAFGASLKNQLIPGLAGAADRMSKLATASKQLANDKVKLIQSVRESEKALNAQKLTAAATFDYIGNKGPKGYLSLRDSIKAGTAEMKDQEKGLRSLNQSLRLNEQILANHKDYQGDDNPKRIAKLQEVEATRAEIKAVEDLRAARANADKFDAESSARVQAARTAAKIASREALAQTSAAASIGAASQLQLGESWKQLTLSVRAYASAQALAAGGTITTMGTIRTAAFAASVGVRALGTAFLTFLPYLALIIGALGLLKSAWDGLKTDSIKEMEKALEAFNETSAKAVQYGNEIKRVNESQVATATRVAASLTIQSNAIREIVERYEELIAKTNAADSDSVFKNIFDGITGGDNGANTVASFWERLGSRSESSYLLGFRRNSEVLDLAETLRPAGRTVEALDQSMLSALKTLNSLNEAAPDKLAAWVQENYGSWENLNKTIAKNPALLQDVARKAGQELNKALGDTAEKIKTTQEAFKQLESDLATFYRSAAISTPFDGVVKSVTAANNSVLALINTYKSNGDSLKILTGLDSNTRGSLSADLQEQIKLLQQQEAAAQNIVKTEKERLGASVSVSVAYQEAQKSLAKLDNQAKSLGASAAQELMALEKKFLLAQETTRQYAAQQTLLQAQIGSNSDLYKAGAAGLRAKISDEEKIRSLQKAQLQVQIDVLKASVSVNESRAEALRQSILDNEALLKKIELTSKLNIEQQKTALAAKGVSEETLKSLSQPGFGVNQAGLFGITDEETKKLIGNYLSDTKAIEKANKDLIAQKGQLRAAEQASRDILASIRSLSTQIQAIDAQNLNAAQKAAKFQEAELEFRKGNLAALRANKALINELNSIHQDTEATIAGTANSFKYQLDIITQTAKTQRDQREAARKDTIRELTVAKNLALAEQARTGLTSEQKAAADSLVTVADEALKIAEQSYQLDIQKIDAIERQAIAAKVYFDTAKEGIEWQRTSLDMFQKQIEAQKTLREETTRVEELRTRLAYKRAGLEISKDTEQSFEIKAAADAYKFAVQESEIKKSLIDLEFALLEAQRDQLREELTERRRIIAEKDPNSTRVAQLDASIARIENVNFEAASNAAKRTIDRQVEAAKVLLDTALTREPTGLNKSLSNFLGYFDRRRAEAQARATREDATPISSAKVIKPESEAEKAAKMASTNPLIVSNNRLVEVIESWISTIEKAVGVTVPAGTARTASGLKDSIESDLGVRVTSTKRRAGQAGKAGNRSYHVTDRAMDIAPSSKVTPQDIINYLAKNGAKGIKFIDETDPAIMKKTGATGPHWHFQWDEMVTKPLVSAIQEVRPAVVDVAKGIVEDSKAVVESNADATITGKKETLAQQTPAAATAATKKNVLVDALGFFGNASEELRSQLEQFGPQGQVVLSVVEGMMKVGYSLSSMITNIQQANERVAAAKKALVEAQKTQQDTTIQEMDLGAAKAEAMAQKFSAIASVAQQALSMIQSATAASAAAKQEAIDKEIAAEQKRDGKSAESLAKIQALEKKKDEIARKQFNTNKKLQMAQAVISTAAGVAQALAYGPIIGPIMAGVIAAMGAAQIAIIAGTHYQSSATSTGSSVEMPTLNIGKRGDTVDLAKQNTNVGGELGYLRGAQGVGSNSSNYRVIGSAYGGELPRGYGNSAYVVGEKGPETITPETPITVRPANDNSNGAPIDATINIRALDARGIEDILRDQRGNIISMLREAANDSGQRFLEDVDVNVYTRPNVGRL